MTTMYLISFFAVVIAVAFAAYLAMWVKRQNLGNARIEQIGKLIRDGANTFMRREYKLLACFAGVVAVLILIFLPRPFWSEGANFLDNVKMVIAYVAGTVMSAITGKLGVYVATLANTRAARAASEGIKPAFLVGFRGGAVMGLGVVSMCLLGVMLVLMLAGDTTALLGFSFGASSLALFAKAGGGIFTKTADVSADLTGKVELGIPEDDPRNPAVIADNVGDNVGDVAGMGADLFDSNVAAMAAALVLAFSLDGGFGVCAEMVFCYAALGLLASALGIAFARIGKNGNPTNALNASTYVTTGIFLVLTAVSNLIFFSGEAIAWRVWGASAVGLVVGVIMTPAPSSSAWLRLPSPARPLRSSPAWPTASSLRCRP